MKCEVVSYLVKDYMKKDVDTIDFDSTVTKAAEIMAANKYFWGYIVVLEKGKPVGIITERDFVIRVVAKKIDPAKTKASEIMSTPLITVDPNTSVLEASRVMQDNKIRKLVVVRNGIMHGVITWKLLLSLI